MHVSVGLNLFNVAHSAKEFLTLILVVFDWQVLIKRADPFHNNSCFDYKKRSNEGNLYYQYYGTKYSNNVSIKFLSIYTGAVSDQPKGFFRVSIKFDVLNNINASTFIWF